MKFRIVAIVVVGTVLVGCTTQVPEETPTTTVSAPTTTVPTPTQTVTPVPTSEPTPTPMWTREEQAAIDAVIKFNEIWSEIARNPAIEDRERIRDITVDPIASICLDQWDRWVEKEWHIIGQALFTADWVKPGPLDDVGQRYYVHGCYIVDGYLSDSSGVNVGHPEPTRSRTTVEVINIKGKYYVVTGPTEEGEC